MELYLIRHTRPAVPEGMCYGRDDVPLDPADLQLKLPQILQQLPRGMPFYTSPASRCKQLADMLVVGSGGTAATVDPRMHEMHFGDWEGRLWGELPIEETTRWTSDIVHYSPPNGENFMAMWTRVAAFYQDMLNAALAGGQDRLAIVGHAGSLKVLLMRALKLAPDQFAAFDMAQGRVARLDVNKTPEGELYEKLMFLNR